MTLSTKITERDDNTFLIKLEGSLDTQTSPDFQKELKGIIDDQIKGITLDMSELTYISSAGIGAIMWTRKILKEKNAIFNMANLQPQIHEVFEVMKILCSNLCNFLCEIERLFCKEL